MVDPWPLGGAYHKVDNHVVDRTCKEERTAWDRQMWEFGKVKACDWRLMLQTKVFLLLNLLIYGELESLWISGRQTPWPH